MKREIAAYIKTWESRCYLNGLPDEAPAEIFDKVPSYKKIAIAILRNDLRPLGIEPKASKYYSMLKRIEIAKRPTKYKQLELFK